MAKGTRPAVPPELLSRLRAICLELPHAEESLSYGNPAFKVDRRPFVVLDHYRGAFCVWIRCPPSRRAAILEQPGFSPSPYDTKELAVCADPGAVEWTRLAELIRESYELTRSR